MDRQEWRLCVLAGDDTLRQERLTRDLYEELRGTDGIDLRFADPAPSGVPGSKGGIAGELVLWATLGMSGAQAAKVLVTLIREWSARERHRKIEISCGDDSLTITGRPDQAQERLIGDFLDRIEGRDRAE
ncbi:hypothetical protein ACFY4C_16395 [Actinomadura viridis]|uniref:hypothetical protein n=1 Tax=Actinomadura viridis TaxID=58110 RepID=UPI0036BC6391